MDHIEEIREHQKKETKEYSELFLKTQNAILASFEKISKISERHFLDGYFIFYHGENAVCHFKLKKYPQWLFGIWLRYMEEKDPGKDKINVQIFAQIEENIDKFKPTRSEFLSEFDLYKEYKEDEESGDIIKLDTFNLKIDEYQLDPFKMIWNKPYLAMYIDIYSVDLNEEYTSPLKAFFLVKKYFIEKKNERNKQRGADKFLTHKITKWFNKNLKKQFDGFEFSIHDSGDNVSPRFHPKAVITNVLSDVELNEFEYRYNDYKDKIMKKKYGENSWLYDSFGWIYWYEFTDGSEEDTEKED